MIKTAIAMLFIVFSMSSAFADDYDFEVVKAYNATYSGFVFVTGSTWIMLDGGAFNTSKVIDLGLAGYGLDTKTVECLKSLNVSGNPAKVTGIIQEYKNGGKGFKAQSITYCGPKK